MFENTDGYVGFYYVIHGVKLAFTRDYIHVEFVYRYLIGCSKPSHYEKRPLSSSGSYI